MQDDRRDQAVGAAFVQDFERFPRQVVGQQPRCGLVEEKQGDKATIIELTVAPEDMGKVIGKQGRIAKAIRTVVKAASIKENKKYIVEII